MPRIKIELPAHFSFSTTIPVRITDVNYGGHVGNDSILSLIHEARVQFLKHYGWTEMDLAGAGLIMSDVAIEFKNELFYGGSLQVFVAAANLSRVGFELFYRLVSSVDEKLIAVAKTSMITYDYDKRKVVALPEVVAQKFTSV